MFNHLYSPCAGHLLPSGSRSLLFGFLRSQLRVILLVRSEVLSTTPAGCDGTDGPLAPPWATSVALTTSRNQERWQ
jgi:hypothetical protein